MKIPQIAIVGGGWAGLSAAFHLSDKNVALTVFDAAPQLGGRARGVPFGAMRVDNGQHLLMSAYTEIKSLLHKLNPNNLNYLEAPFTVSYRRHQRPRALQLPEQLSFLAGLHSLWRARGFTWVELWRLSRFMLKLPHLTAEAEETAETFLQQHQQGGELLSHFWGPLCLAALSTPVTRASARVWLQVLQSIFSQAKFSNILLPTCELSAFFPEPIAQSLIGKGHQIQCSTRLKGLQRIESTGTFVLQFQNQQREFDALILATPPKITAQLLDNALGCQKICQQLNAITFEPITTVYLQYDKALSLTEPFFGLLDSTAHWVFHRAFCHQADILAAVITGALPQGLSAEVLAYQIDAELRAFHELPALRTFKVIQEKKAAFSCTPENEQHRIQNKTPWPNLVLAGDFTDTSYPASLEGAVKSGRIAAELLNY